MYGEDIENWWTAPVTEQRRSTGDDTDSIKIAPFIEFIAAALCDPGVPNYYTQPVFQKVSLLIATGDGTLDDGRTVDGVPAAMCPRVFHRFVKAILQLWSYVTDVQSPHDQSPPIQWTDRLCQLFTISLQYLRSLGAVDIELKCAVAEHCLAVIEIACINIKSAHNAALRAGVTELFFDIARDTEATLRGIRNADERVVVATLFRCKLLPCLDDAMQLLRPYPGADGSKCSADFVNKMASLAKSVASAFAPQCAEPTGDVELAGALSAFQDFIRATVLRSALASESPSLAEFLNALAPPIYEPSALLQETRVHSHALLPPSSSASLGQIAAFFSQIIDATRGINDASSTEAEALLWRSPRCFFAVLLSQLLTRDPWKYLSVDDVKELDTLRKSTDFKQVDEIFFSHMSRALASLCNEVPTLSAKVGVDGLPPYYSLLGEAFVTALLDELEGNVCVAELLYYMHSVRSRSGQTNDAERNFFDALFIRTDLLSIVLSRMEAGGLAGSCFFLPLLRFAGVDDSFDFPPDLLASVCAAAPNMRYYSIELSAFVVPMPARVPNKNTILSNCRPDMTAFLAQILAHPKFKPALTAVAVALSRYWSRDDVQFCQSVPPSVISCCQLMFSGFLRILRHGDSEEEEAGRKAILNSVRVEARLVATSMKPKPHRLFPSIDRALEVGSASVSEAAPRLLDEFWRMHSKWLADVHTSLYDAMKIQATMNWQAKLVKSLQPILSRESQKLAPIVKASKERLRQAIAGDTDDKAGRLMCDQITMAVLCRSFLGPAEALFCADFLAALSSSDLKWKYLFDCISALVASLTAVIPYSPKYVARGQTMLLGRILSLTFTPIVRLKVASEAYAAAKQYCAHRGQTLEFLLDRILRDICASIDKCFELNSTNSDWAACYLRRECCSVLSAVSRYSLRVSGAFEKRLKALKEESRSDVVRAPIEEGAKIPLQPSDDVKQQEDTKRIVQMFERKKEEKERDERQPSQRNIGFKRPRGEELESDNNPRRPPPSTPRESPKEARPPPKAEWSSNTQRYGRRLTPPRREKRSRSRSRTPSRERRRSPPRRRLSPPRRPPRYSRR